MEDKARQIYLANKREFDRKKAARKAEKQKPAITGLMKRDAARHAKALDSRLPPRDRE